jgi:hypothetical protein
MGVVSFFGGLSTKKPTATTQASAIKTTENALKILFRDIASEKNQMLYPALSNIISHAEHQASVIASAKNLLQALTVLIFSLKNKPIDPSLLDLVYTTELLEKSIIAYQKNDQVLSQLLLICSSIKIHVEKIRCYL